jgi:hypothetical protein
MTGMEHVGCARHQAARQYARLAHGIVDMGNVALRLALKMKR